jgi:hypothetical protein
MRCVRKWLGSSIELRLRWGELLAIVAFVILVNIVWPGAPVWVFALFGFAAGASGWVWRDFRRWLHRRSTA